jgi:hypothetical protein
VDVWDVSRFGAGDPSRGSAAIVDGFAINVSRVSVID